MIGIILGGYLRAFLGRRTDPETDFGRVKLRIDGNNANETIPILKKDSVNNLFGKTKFATEYIRSAKIIQ